MDDSAWVEIPQFSVLRGGHISSLRKVYHMWQGDLAHSPESGKDAGLRGRRQEELPAPAGEKIFNHLTILTCR